MKLFSIKADDYQDYVEAMSMIEAIQVWIAHMKGDSTVVEPEPEEVLLVHDEPVLRAEITHGK